MAQSISEDDAEMQVLQFAEALADFVASETAKSDKAPQSVEILRCSLPRLLRAFALRLGCVGSSKTEREVMFFVHKHRKDIASRFQYALTMDSQSHRSGSSGNRRERVDLSTVHAFIRRWLDGLGNYDENSFQMPSLDESLDAAEGDNDVTLPDKGEYNRIVFESAAYLWLTAALKRELSLAPVPSQEAICGKVYHDVLSCLERGRKEVSSRRPSERFTLHLSADWNPVAFLRQEFTDSAEPLGKLLTETLTLTGSATDAQVLPCEMYVRQTWPAFGPSLLPLLQRALHSGGEQQGTLLDKTVVKLKVDSRLSVEVQGSADTVAEVVELVAWLSAALRTPEDGGLSLCLPSISIAPNHQASLPSFVCSLRFTTRRVVPDSTARSILGQCWHKLFRNPVVVEGYPIPRRSRYDSGLEVPLNIMSRLTESPRIHQYMGKFLLKGFSTVVLPTDILDDALLWPLYCADDGSRIPYPDFAHTRCADAVLTNIRSRRHILGWCTEASICAEGSKNMNYNIKGSKLRSPGKEFSLEKVSFSVGQIVTGGCQFSVGHKDIPVRITRGGYIAKLRWIRQRYFTLWDVDESRGWLVDGASTLLHLLRASLHQSSTDDFSSEFIFDESKFCEPNQPFKKGAALEVLLNKTNRALDLYREEEKTGVVEHVLPDGRIQSKPHTRVRTTTVQDRTEELYETLEKLVDHKHLVEASYKGADAKPRFHDRLEGWDFADLAEDRDPFHLKVATLPAHKFNTTWVDYTRAIPAVTLFGRGFGDLIRPSIESSPPQKHHCPQANNICRGWASVPKDQNYLCVSVADLQITTDRIGDPSTNPFTLAPGISWHVNPAGASPFSRCPCQRPNTLSTQTTPTTRHPVQELAPSTMNFLYNRDTAFPPDLSAHPNGALIFGTPTRNWPWKTPLAPIAATPTELDSEKEKAKNALASDLSSKTSEALSLSGSSSSSHPPSQDSSLSQPRSESATTPHSVTSEEASSSAKEETQRGGTTTGGKRRAWWSTSGDGADGDLKGGEGKGVGGQDLLRRFKRARGS
ncbi:hypothetical protein QBC34DRAFT_345840 [Podospora aff. communis PSN243]|uniref:DNA helicase n=1 Tax=Podospora aff. communis PSN243 TaxID=3040156 RepID=A0AAV9GZK0_9PEZI|nr:hypothetical protein QBC34DRAFT_345840 [Podospora aff. communis PSN243]